MNPKHRDELLWKLEGLHTIETAAKGLGLTKQSTLNLLSRLKKEGYVTLWSGGGKRKRIYKITTIKQRPREPGMWDIINKYSPNFQPRPWYDHQVHGPYGPEEALIDALQTQSFRLILASLRLFNHITDWPKLYHLANEKDCWQKVGALYDVARLFFRVRRMPERYLVLRPSRWVALTQLRKRNFPDLSRRWKVYIPFNINDVRELG
ncbi:MAG: hypothetical protein AABX13_04310 [Nanoarchaeota archaeon]